VWNEDSIELRSFLNEDSLNKTTLLKNRFLYRAFSSQVILDAKAANILVSNDILLACLAQEVSTLDKKNTKKNQFDVYFLEFDWTCFNESEFIVILFLKELRKQENNFHRWVEVALINQMKVDLFFRRVSNSSGFNANFVYALSNASTVAFTPKSENTHVLSEQSEVNSVISDRSSIKFKKKANKKVIASNTKRKLIIENDKKIFPEKKVDENVLTDVVEENVDDKTTSAELNNVGVNTTDILSKFNPSLTDFFDIDDDDDDDIDEKEEFDDVP
jgi:hypothetical protein